MPLQQGMKANVYLRCKAGVQGTFCTGTLTLTIDGQSVAADYRIVTRQSAALTVRLPQRARAAAQSHTSTALHATLKISTKQSDGLDKVLTGALTIEPAG